MLVKTASSDLARKIFFFPLDRGAARCYDNCTNTANTLNTAERGDFVRSKIFLAAPLVILCAAVLFWLWWNQPIGGPDPVSEDEISLRIKLETKEDFGLLLIDYDANGSGGRGGMSNANKSLIKHNELLFYTLPKRAFDNPSDVENLSIQFTVITEYFEPNFEEIYPEEYTIPMDAISLNAEFGQAYSIIIYGDMANGYQAVLTQ